MFYEVHVENQVCCFMCILCLAMGRGINECLTEDSHKISSLIFS